MDRKPHSGSYLPDHILPNSDSQNESDKPSDLLYGLELFSSDDTTGDSLPGKASRPGTPKEGRSRPGSGTISRR